MPMAVYMALAFLAGVGLPLSMAPFHWHGLAILSVMFFVHMVYRHVQRYAVVAWLGFCYGLGVYGVGVSWLYVSIHSYAYVAWPLAVCMVVLGVVVLAAVFFMPLAWLAAVLWARYRRWYLWTLIFPSLWVCFELFRTYAFGGFPWPFLGDSQLGWPLAGIVPILGVYGASWFTVLSAVCVYHMFTIPMFRIRVALFAGMVVLWSSVAWLHTVHWTHPLGAQKTVNIIQPNVSLYDKWQVARLPYLLDRYSHMLSEAKDADLNVLPEGALPTINMEVVRAWLAKQDQAAKSRHTHTIVGAMLDNGPYNAMLMLGRDHGVYIKQHLVPFGEYVPFSSVMGPISHWLNIPMSHLQSVRSMASSLPLGPLSLTPAICYETAFPIEFAHKVAKTHGSVLLAVSEDGWYGDSIEPYQHLQTAQMRALETGRPFIFATNQGVSAVIDAQGHLMTQSDVQVEAILHATVQPYDGDTPWLAWGQYNIVWLTMCPMLLALLIWHGGQWRCAWFRKKRR
jgi:apolipoprotein N-acyltransferase